MSPNSGPGYAKYPAHTVHVSPADKHVVVTFDGSVIADTTRALCLREANYPPVYYVPRDDVRMDRLVRTDHRTHCPFKGDASYFTLTGTRTAENAVWSYESPYDEVAPIKEFLAFYPNRVDSLTVD
jgi:uncharacterized protein (DUF427 family)